MFDVGIPKSEGAPSFPMCTHCTVWACVQLCIRTVCERVQYVHLCSIGDNSACILYTVGAYVTVCASVQHIAFVLFVHVYRMCMCRVCACVQYVLMYRACNVHVHEYCTDENE